MSFQETDISWQLLRRIVQEWSGTAAELEEVKPLDGGMINTTLCLTLKDGKRAVLKISPHRVNRDYEREVHQLELLRSVGIPTPTIYELHPGSLEDPNSYILMEYVPGIDLNEAKRQCTSEEFDRLQEHLAEIMRTMHGQTSPVYRRITSADGDTGFDDWPAFFRHVYDPIIREADKRKDLSPKTRKQIGKIHEKLDRVISHGDVPRLVHWDVWSTNLLARKDETGGWRICAVLDPNCKYAHAESEIAYIDLFHTGSPVFMKAYQQGNRLDDYYHRVRKPIYQLYPLINDFVLYGQDYAKPMLAALDRAAALV